MPWIPASFGGGIAWVNNQAPALDAANLDLQENEEAAYAVQIGQSVVDYFENNQSGKVASILLPSGGDDTAAINAAGSSGQRLGAGTFKISGVVTQPFVGSGSGQTTIQCTSAGGKIQFGPALGGTPIHTLGIYGGFTLDGRSLVPTPLVLNCVDGLFHDVTCAGGTGPSIGVYGQNCLFNKLAADSLVLDNGCGGNVFMKPEIHGPGITENIIIQQSVAPPSGSYATPENNFFYGGIAEFTVSNKSCVRQSAGNYNRFKDFNFFTNSLVPLVTIDPNGGSFAAINDSLIFDDCLWTGNWPGSVTGQYGISCVNSSGGVAQALPGGDVPVILYGLNVFAGLEYAVNWGVTNQIWNQGIIRYYTGTNDFRKAATNAPLTFNYFHEPNFNAALINSWVPPGSGLAPPSYYRQHGRIYLAGQATGGVLGSPMTQLPLGYRPGGYCVYNQLGTRVDVDQSGNVTPQSGGSNTLVSLDGIDFQQATY